MKERALVVIIVFLVLIGIVSADLPKTPFPPPKDTSLTASSDIPPTGGTLPEQTQIENFGGLTQGQAPANTFVAPTADGHSFTALDTGTTKSGANIVGAKNIEVKNDGSSKAGEAASEKQGTSEVATAQNTEFKANGDFSFSGAETAKAGTITATDSKNGKYEGQGATDSSGNPVGVMTVDEASSVTQGTTEAKGIKSGRFLQNGEFSINSADSVKVGNNLLTNAKDVRYSNGVLSAGSASLGKISSAGFQNAQQLTAPAAGSTLYVSSAELITIEGIRTESVRDTTFKLGTNIEAKTANGISYTITDAAGNTFTYTAKEDAKLILSKDKVAPAHFLQNGIINFKHDGTSESVDSGTNGESVEPSSQALSAAQLAALQHYKSLFNTIKSKVDSTTDEINSAIVSIIARKPATNVLLKETDKAVSSLTIDLEAQYGETASNHPQTQNTLDEIAGIARQEPSVSGKSSAKEGGLDQILFTQFGMERITLTPISTYSFKTGDVKRDFSLKANQSEQQLFIRKDVSQSVPSVFNNCDSCTIVDFPASQITINGHILYLRNSVTKQGNYQQIIAYEGLGKVLLNLDSRFDKAKVQLSGSKWSRTRLNNYVWLEEKAGHRFLGVNEKLAKEEIGEPVITTYKTDWSDSAVEYTGGVFDYKRGKLRVRVFEPGMAILAIGGLLIPFMRKKGQITIFIMLGIILIAIILLLFAALPSEKQRPFVKDSIQEYVTDCLKLATETAMKQELGVLYDRGKAKYLDPDAVGEEIAGLAELGIPNCVGGSVFGAEVEKGTPEIKVIAADTDTPVSMKYPLVFKKEGQEIKVEEFAYTDKARVKKAVQQINAVTQSQKENNELIDLDALETDNWDIVFYPKDGLMGRIKDTLMQNVVLEWGWGSMR